MRTLSLVPLTMAAMLLSSTAMAGIFESVKDTEIATAEDVQEDAATANTQSTARTISTRIRSAVRFSPQSAFRSNVSAGLSTAIIGADDDGYSNIGLWLNAGGESLRQEPTDFTSKTNIISGLTGGDIFLTDNLLVGVVASGSKIHSDSTSSFAGGSTNNVDQKTRSLGLTVYSAYVFNEFFYIDGLIGATRDEHSSFHTSNGGVFTNIDVDQRGNTRYAGLNGNVGLPITDQFTGTATVGVLRTLTEVSDAKDTVNPVGFNDVPGSKSNSTIYSVGGQLSYLFSEQVVFYGGVQAEIFGKTEQVGLANGVAGASGTNLQDKDDWQARWTVGADVFSDEGMTVSAEGGFVTFRENTENWTLGFNARWDF